MPKYCFSRFFVSGGVSDSVDLQGGTANLRLKSFSYCFFLLPAGVPRVCFKNLLKQLLLFQLLFLQLSFLQLCFAIVLRDCVLQLCVAIKFGLRVLQLRLPFDLCFATVICERVSHVFFTLVSDVCVL